MRTVTLATHDYIFSNLGETTAAGRLKYIVEDLVSEHPDDLMIDSSTSSDGNYEAYIYSPYASQALRLYLHTYEDGGTILCMDACYRRETDWITDRVLLNQNSTSYMELDGDTMDAVGMRVNVRIVDACVVVNFNRGLKQSTVNGYVDEFGTNIYELGLFAWFPLYDKFSESQYTGCAYWGVDMVNFGGRPYVPFFMSDNKGNYRSLTEVKVGGDIYPYHNKRLAVPIMFASKDVGASSTAEIEDFYGYICDEEFLYSLYAGRGQTIGQMDISESSKYTFANNTFELLFGPYYVRLIDSE